MTRQLCVACKTATRFGFERAVYFLRELRRFDSETDNALNPEPQGPVPIPATDRRDSGEPVLVVVAQSHEILIAPRQLAGSAHQPVNTNPQQQTDVLKHTVFFRKIRDLNSNVIM